MAFRRNVRIVLYRRFEHRARNAQVIQVNNLIGTNVERLSRIGDVGQNDLLGNAGLHKLGQLGEARRNLEVRGSFGWLHHLDGVRASSRICFGFCRAVRRIYNFGRWRLKHRHFLCVRLLLIASSAEPQTSGQKR